MPAREQQTAAPTPEPPLENKSSEMLPIMISEILPVMIADCRLPILSSPHAHAPRRWPVSIKKRGPSPALPVCFFTSRLIAVSKSSLPNPPLIFCKPADKYAGAPGPQLLGTGDVDFQTQPVRIEVRCHPERTGPQTPFSLGVVKRRICGCFSAGCARCLALALVLRRFEGARF